MNHEEVIKYLQRKHDDLMDAMLESALEGNTSDSDKAAKQAHACDEVIAIIRKDINVGRIRSNDSGEDRGSEEVLCRKQGTSFRSV